MEELERKWATENQVVSIIRKMADRRDRIMTARIMQKELQKQMRMTKSLTGIRNILKAEGYKWRKKAPI